MRILSQKDVRACINMEQAITLMKTAFIELSVGEGVVPVRHILQNPNNKTTALFMPASLPQNNSLGLKVVGMNENNLDINLPLINAVILLLDTKTGTPITLMDASWITALRTGAGSGLATDLLARKDANTAVIFGVGVQAKTQLEAICAVRAISKVWVINRTISKIDAFCEEMTAKLDVEIVTGTLEHIKQADIICTATTAFEPLFQHNHLKEGAHINAIGAYTAEMSEVSPETIANSRLVVDRQDACLHEAGDIIKAMKGNYISKSDVNCELGEVAAKVKSGRQNEHEITVFKSVGNAAQDLVVAQYVYKKATEKKLG
ncbi:MAG: hypothetical protein AAGI07_13930, partial [Bacteroidota bacterium]